MTAKEKRAKAILIAKSRIKMNKYTQGSLRAYVGGYPQPGNGVKGYSDCSKFVEWVLKQVLGYSIGSNTSAQVANRGRGVLIEKAISSQTYPTEADMEPGDCIYWKGTPSHVWDVGHVEMYLGGGKCIGHGGGTGPTVKTLKTYSKGRGSGDRKYLCVIRWIPDDPEAALGDRLLKLGDDGPDVLELQQLLKAVGYGSLLGKWGPNKDGCDGEYGSDTKLAVKTFEVAQGLFSDGVADIDCITRIKMVAGRTQGKVRITGATVYVRSGPGTDHKAIATVTKGTVLELNGDDTEAWRGVIYKGTSAYVSAKYTEVV